MKGAGGMKYGSTSTEAVPATASALCDKAESRIMRLKERVLGAPYEICIERARYYTGSFMASEGKHPAIRQALALRDALAKMSIHILDEERIVGNRSSKILGTVIPVERGDVNRVLELDINRITKRSYRPFHISKADKKELLNEILPYWDGKTVHDKRKQRWKDEGYFTPIRIDPLDRLKRRKQFNLMQLAKRLYRVAGLSPRYWKEGGEELEFNNPLLTTDVFDVQGHIVLGHRSLIRTGLRGVEEKARKRLAQLRSSGGDAEGESFLEAVIICCQAAKAFAQRYAKLAEEKARAESDPARASELEAIARRCKRVPYDPPRDFAEAVQFVWLAQTIAVISYGMGGFFAVGRADQYLYPYYKRDVEAGLIAPDEATELLEEFLIKLSANLLLLPPLGRETASELGADAQALTIGGLGPDGEDATNELSELFLDAIGRVRCMANSISIRISSKTTESFLSKSITLYRKTSGPALFNDDAIVPSLIGCGYTEQEARDYAIIGCVEPTGAGDTFGATSGNDVSLVGPVEMVLLNGYLRMLGQRVGPQTGDPRQFKTFDDFMEAYKKQLSFCMDMVARSVYMKEEVYKKEFPSPFVSLMLDGCVDSARDMTQGGVRHNFGAITARGFGTAADSLIAVKQLVFEQKLLSMDELVKAISDNFRGQEHVRQMLLNKAGKYGMDDDEADAMARQLAEFFCRNVSSYSTPRGGILRPGYFSYGMHVYDGAVLGASPDGRKGGQPVSNSISPSNGSERTGLTAMLRSVSKLDHMLIPNGYSLNARLLPSLLRTKEDCEKLAAVVRAYFLMDGMHVQFNVVSSETLKEARREPDKHKDLVVRVSGYSAYFVDLGEEVQEDIINRTEFAGF